MAFFRVPFAAAAAIAAVPTIIDTIKSLSGLQIRWQTVPRNVLSNSTSINCKCGWFVDSITFINNAGESIVYGGPGGDRSHSAELQADEYIIEVFGIKKAVLHVIAFKTNKGRTLGPWGEPGPVPGGDICFCAPPGQRLLELEVAITWFMSYEVVHSIKPVWGPEP